MTDEDFMKVAIEEAKKTLIEGGLPVGGVLACEGKLIARGRKQVEDFHLGHAEIEVLNMVFKNNRIPKGKEFTLYTTIEPCVMCFGTILHCPITRVVYALEDTWGGATSLNDQNLPERHKNKTIDIDKGMFREEVRALAKDFLKITNDPYWNDQTNVFVQTIMK